MREKKNIQDKDKELEESRKGYFEESKFDAKNQKYGLFSFSGTLAVSETPYFTKTLSKKNSQGKIPTRPKNFMTRPLKRGKTPDVYFSNPGYQSDSVLLKAKNLKSTSKPSTAATIEVPWKPGGLKGEKPSSYPYKSEEPVKRPSRKGPDGMIELGLRNLYTSPPKTGSGITTPGVLIGGNKYDYMSEPYDRKHKIVQEEIKKDKEKRLGRPFKSPNPTGRNFSNNIQTYGDFPVKKRIRRSASVNYYKHEVPFLPNSPGKIGSTIGKFPEYIPDPLTFPKRKVPSEQIPWKHTTMFRTRPTPSISYSATNLRAEYKVLRKRIR